MRMENSVRGSKCSRQCLLEEKLRTGWLGSHSQYTSWYLVFGAPDSWPNLCPLSGSEHPPPSPTLLLPKQVLRKELKWTVWHPRKYLACRPKTWVNQTLARYFISVWFYISHLLKSCLFFEPQFSLGLFPTCSMYFKVVLNYWAQCKMWSLVWI